jgi:hypothetical protein
MSLIPERFGFRPRFVMKFFLPNYPKKNFWIKNLGEASSPTKSYSNVKYLIFLYREIILACLDRIH